MSSGPTIIMQKARDLLADPDKWTKGSFARTAEGDRVGFSDPEATCWCLMGALNVAIGERVAELKRLTTEDVWPEVNEKADEYFNDVTRILHSTTQNLFNSLVEFNDNDFTCHADVINVLDLGIEMAEAEQ